MISTVQVILPIVVVLAVLVIWQVRAEEIEVEFELSGKSRSVELTPLSPLPPLCMDHEVSERIRNIMNSALDNQIKVQAEKMFENWVRDPTDQPARATAGLRRTFEAYLQALRAVRDWRPKPCEEEGGGP